MRLRSVTRAIRGFCSKHVQSRNIIVVSDVGVQHYPISPKLQWAGMMGVITLFCFISYTTGSYMAAKTVLREKDQKIVSTSMANKRILHEFSMLKRDLEKLSQSDGENNTEYSKFIVSQYNNDARSEMEKIGLLGDEEDQEEGDKVMERITFLENKITELQASNDAFVEAVKERTAKRIDDFEDIIAMTGLDTRDMKRHAALDLKREQQEAIRQAPAASSGRAEGGPYIPLDIESMDKKDKELFSNIDQMVSLHNLIEALPLAVPVKNAEMQSPFGRRVDPFTHRWAMHSGLDLAGPDHSQIYSTTDGEVTWAGKRFAYGNMVEVTNSYGISTRYGHMSRVLVKEGQMVKKGQLVGIQGSTGRSTGQHLHYEVRYNGRAYNPIKFLEAGKYVLKN